MVSPLSMLPRSGIWLKTYFSLSDLEGGLVQVEELNSSLDGTDGSHARAARFKAKSGGQSGRSGGRGGHNGGGRGTSATVKLAHRISGSRNISRSNSSISRGTSKSSPRISRSNSKISRVIQRLGGRRGYDDSIPGQVTKTLPSGDRIARSSIWPASLPRIQLFS